MTVKNLNISIDTQNSTDLLLGSLQESVLKQLIISYHSNKIREIIAENTDEFSVFHYEEHNYDKMSRSNYTFYLPQENKITIRFSDYKHTEELYWNFVVNLPIFTCNIHV